MKKRVDRTVPAKPRYMLDANAFDYILDRGIDPWAVRRLGEICITSVQHGELLAVPDPLRRKRLLRVLSAIDPTVRPPPAGLRVDGTREDDRGAREGQRPDAAPRRLLEGTRERGWKDAAIGEVAVLDGCTLVTEDRGFGSRAVELGVPVLTCEEAFADLDSRASAPDARTRPAARRRRPGSRTGRSRPARTVAPGTAGRRGPRARR